jgi:hypothetical protein
MILVRMVFQAKWGKAGQAANDYKQNAELMRKVLGPDVRVRFLTDLSGPFDTFVQEMEVESLAAWEKLRVKIFTNPEFHEVLSRRENPFESGRTEFYTIEATI